MSNFIIEKDYSNFFSPPRIYENQQEFIDSQLSNGQSSHIIKFGLATLDIDIDIQDSRMLVVFLAGAKSQKNTIKPPFFTCKGISKTIKATSIFISDPTFTINSSSQLAWFAGNTEIRAQHVIVEIIKSISIKLKSERILFFGGSGGGFASLFFSFHFANSLALVWNPQTSIENYKKEISEHYASTAFGVTASDLKEHICSNLKQLYNGESHKNLICYMQNITDHHVTGHLIPLIRDFCDIDTESTFSGLIYKNFYLHLTNWSQHHRPPPKQALAYLLKYHSNPDVTWSIAKLKKSLLRAERLSTLVSE